MYLFWLATSYNNPSFTVVIPLTIWVPICFDAPIGVSVQQPMIHFIIIIAFESGTHVQRKVSHFFPYQTQQQMDILITKDGFQTLMDVIIVDSIHTNMVQRASTTMTHVMMMVAQEKTRSYAE